MICQDCARPLTPLEGRCCAACRQWRRRRGLRVRDAVPGGWTRLTAPPGSVATRPQCRTCRSRPRHAQRRCKPCYAYWRRTGRERPAGPLQPRRPAPPACRTCGFAPVVARGWCGACYAYWRRHGTERPPDPPPFVCIECQRPGVHWAHGRCHRCINRAWARAARARRKETAA